MLEGPNEIWFNKVFWYLSLDLIIGMIVDIFKVTIDYLDSKKFEIKLIFHVNCRIWFWGTVSMFDSQNGI